MKPTNRPKTSLLPYYSLAGGLLFTYLLALLVFRVEPPIEQPAFLINDAFTFECPSDTTITICDPLECIEFEGPSAGTIINAVETRFGPVNIEAFRSNDPNSNAAMIFDTGNPTGGDEDLGTPNENFGGPGEGVAGEPTSKYRNDQFRGNVLIISEDLNQDNPDDASQGGTIVFDFSEIGPVILHSLSLVDGEEAIDLIVDDGVVSAQVEPAGDNGFITIDLLGTVAATKLTVIAGGSFSVDQLCFSKNYRPRFPEITITDPNVADPVPSITFTDNLINVIDQNNFTIEREFTMIVDTGNGLAVDSCTQLITVVDDGNTTTGFVCPADVDLGCNPEPGDFPDIIPSNGDLIIRVSDDTIKTDCEGQITSTFVNARLVRTYIATNDCGIRDTCTQVISWKEDVQAPDLSAVNLDTTLCPSDPYLENTMFSDPSITDNCGIEQVSLSILSQDTSANRDTVLIQRQLVAVDSCQNRDSVIQTIRVLLADASICAIRCPRDTMLGCISDPTTDVPPLLTQADAPIGITLVSQEDTLKNGCSVEIQRTYIYSSDFLIDTCVQLISWTFDTIPPDVSLIPSDTVVCLFDPYSNVDETDLVCGQASDNCGIETCQVEDNGTTDFVNSDTLFVLLRSVTVTDSCGNVSTVDQNVFVVNSNVGTCECPLDQDLGCISPTDLPDPLTQADFSSTLLSFSSESMTSENGCDITLIRTYTLLTISGDTLVCPQTITYTDTDVDPVSIDSCETLVLFNEIAPATNIIPPLTEDMLAISGGCDSVEISVLSIDTSEVRTIVQTTGIDTFLRRESRIVTFERAIEARDQCDNRDTCIQKITFISPAFIINTVSVTCNPNPELIPGLVPVDSLDEEIVVNNATQIDSTNGCEITRTQTYDLTISGVLDTVVVRSFSWSIDTVPPVFGNIPDTIIFDGENIPPVDLDSIEVTDNCERVTLVVDEDNVLDTVNCSSVLVRRTFRAIDDCNNSATFEQILFCANCGPDYPELNDTTACENEPLILNVGGNASLGYLWVPSTGLDSDTIASPTFIGDSTTEYTVFIAAGGQCDTSITFTIDVVPLVSIDLQSDPFLQECEPTTVAFQATASPSAELIWSNNINFDTILARGDSLTTFAEEDQTYYVTADVEGGCSAIDSTTFDLLQVDASIPDTLFECDLDGISGFSILVTDNDPDQDLLFDWLVNDSLIQSEDALLTIFNTNAINQPLPLYVDNAFGCSDTLQTFISVPNLPERVEVFLETGSGLAPFSNPLVALPGDTNIVIITGCDECTIRWDNQNGLDDSDPSRVILSPTETTTYTYTVETLAGAEICSISGTVTVEITEVCLPVNYWFANSFFPEGATEVNRTFGVQSNFKDQILEYRFQVFNRWGELVFETNDPEDGWDGTYNGNNSDSGVYGFVATIVCEDGTSLGRFQGNVTLIR